jgi:excinuclease ABC subunit B
MYQTLLGVTGSGKTYTMANVIARLGGRRWCWRQQDAGGAALLGVPRVLPGERGGVFRFLLRLLPAGGLRAVARPVHREGFLDQRAHRADAAVGHQGLLERRDVVIVGTVSAIYGIGDPVDYHGMILHLREGERIGPARRHQAPGRDAVQRNEMDFKRGTFRVRGDVIDIFPAENATRCA